MFRNNSVLIGILLGLAIPFVGYALILTIFEQLEAMDISSQSGLTSTFRQRTIGVISICLNLIPFQYYRKRRYDNSMRGIIISTMFYVFIWILYFGKYIL